MYIRMPEFVCLFYLFLFLPSTIFQLNRKGSSWVEPELSKDKCVLLKDHNAVTPVRLEPTAPGLESSTQPLSHCPPYLQYYMLLKTCISSEQTTLVKHGQKSVKELKFLKMLSKFCMFFFAAC